MNEVSYSAHISNGKSALNSSHIDSELAIQTLKAALERNHYPKNLMLHSDQG